jgi:hypothetical protein
MSEQQQQQAGSSGCNADPFTCDQRITRQEQIMMWKRVMSHLNNSSTAISAAAAGAPGITSTVTLADLARIKPAPLEGGMEEEQQQQQQHQG